MASAAVVPLAGGLDAFLLTLTESRRKVVRARLNAICAEAGAKAHGVPFMSLLALVITSRPPLRGAYIEQLEELCRATPALLILLCNIKTKQMRIILQTAPHMSEGDMCTYIDDVRAEFASIIRRCNAARGVSGSLLSLTTFAHEIAAQLDTELREESEKQEGAAL